ncbi:hypothetical protein H6776_03045 [Candidatus Nomurabacteria bacterium]|nr:hypothetical protein [Candidatus Nomurabacteria bacterium]
MSFFRHSYKSQDHVLPEDTFFEALNVSSFDEQQMEGVLEQSLPARILVTLVGLVLVLGTIVVVQLFRLQVIQGAERYKQSEDNRLIEEIIFAQRGVIFDRSGIPLAWNEEPTDSQTSSGVIDDFTHRAYIAEPGFAHVLGYVQYPALDRNGFYWRRTTEGQAGLELLAQEELAGINGAFLVERDAHMKTSTTSSVREAVDGQNITTTLDADLQARVHRAIAAIVEEDGYQAGAAVFLGVETGDIRVMTSYPEYDPSVMSERKDQKQIREFLKSSRGYFLNRAVSGLYSPGSTVKPIIALGALVGGYITDKTTVYSSGRIEVPNPYNPSQPSIFRDWRRSGHGMTDVKFAIADSVNTFFYAISGGYGNQKGMGIDYMSTFLAKFKIGDPTGFRLGNEPQGVIPNPEWKEEVFHDNWRLGDTYITSIGQFGFQTTPLQLARAFAALGNGGYLVTPRIISDETLIREQISGLNQNDIDTVLAGMRQTVTRGTAQTLKTLPIDMAVKTGTAQVSVSQGINNSWIVGLYPYENPEVAFAVVLERGPNVGARAASSVIVEAFADRVPDESQYDGEEATPLPLEESEEERVLLFENAL